jgi:hypothetical protein
VGSFSITWNAIRPLNGSQQAGFEELCCQLAHYEVPAGVVIERKGTPDGGVECYGVLSDDTEWCWQAKYVASLGEAQWRELDGSVKTALETHPRLVRYFICIPLNRADGRVKGRRSAKERWDDHVRKWTGWATSRNMAVTFVYWGSYELLNRLADPKHVGRVRFWLDARGFDAPWFHARLSEAVKAAGPRYTPEVHVDLPIATEFEAFGRTTRFFDDLRSRARGLRERVRRLEYAVPHTADEAPDIFALASSLKSITQQILLDFGAITSEPLGALTFRHIAAQSAAAAAALDDLMVLLEQERDLDGNQRNKTSVVSPRSRTDSFRERRNQLAMLQAELSSVSELLVHADSVASAKVLVLSGDAGTGKTHLLCDVATRRLQEGRPTLLLMGQRFINTEEPWTQALQQLDLAGLSIEEFVGALEAAAEAAGSLALVMVDALNEGAGRRIWPVHLAAFLAHLERSPWIAVAVAVRSPYEKLVVSEEIRSRAISLEHFGFADYEYDATRTFFGYYGLEMPSTPLLIPEFRNPFLLKMLCVGLKEKGHSRLPRGFHGISVTFDMYLAAVNDRLANELNFNPKNHLVRRALESLAKAFVEAGEGWLPLEYAERVTDELLPGRDFERSLYRGLVVEGVLIEQATWRDEQEFREVVQIAYDRLADHLIAKHLLDKHLDVTNPEAAFEAGAPLSWFSDRDRFIAPGLIEAMCVQVVERTGKELLTLAPSLADRRMFVGAFRNSLVWREVSAFSDATLETFAKLIVSDVDEHQSLEVLLTLATLPEHPLNARFLDRQLRKSSMPERDTWWSIYLYRAWERGGAVHRIIDWAWSVKSSDLLEDETVDLSAITLAWMFTTSNRFVRDRATKALVNLLTGRLEAAVRLVEHFADVDDPYVAERIYAVAYGASMRSHNLTELERLAACVYQHVFATQTPPVHILLRDYARGVVERATDLGASVGVDTEQIRPPYRSSWPNIPTEDDIKPLLPDWSRGSYDSRHPEWARNRIGSSILDDDFAWYVIGTNSHLTSWLSVRLDEPAWRTSQGRLRALIAEFSEEEESAWARFNTLDDKLEKAIQSFFSAWFTKRRALGLASTEESLDGDAVESELENAVLSDPDLAKLEGDRNAAYSTLSSTLTENHASRLPEALNVVDGSNVEREPPRFDLQLLQRYILWRVFDLGWTTERFGSFDRFETDSNGRSARKAERIGKKYQWIAYHEIIALVADHFQYREQFREDDGSDAYEGPWQDSLRDIDPSCTLLKAHAGTGWESHTPAWWGPVQYETWELPPDHTEWVNKSDDLPRLEELLSMVCPGDGSRWVNANGYLSWRQKAPPDRESTDVDRRELWYIFTGYLIRAEDTDSFIAWAEGVDFWGRWMPDPPNIRQLFLGEHSWSPAARYYRQPYYGDDGWTRPRQDCPVLVRAVAIEYVQEASGFDCSVDDSYTLRLPANDLVEGMALRWTGSSADYTDDSDRLLAFDPTAHAEGPNALLLRQDALEEFLARENLGLCWAVLGEKRVLGAGMRPSFREGMRLSGAYALRATGPVGFVKCMIEDGAGEQELKPVVATIRTPEQRS